ncbi:hypothetical protein D3C81_2009550 [compost metagenome]
MHQGFQIDVHDLIPDIQIDIKQRHILTEPQYTCDVGQVINAAESMISIFNCFVDEAWVGQVAFCKQDLVKAGQLFRHVFDVNC